MGMIFEKVLDRNVLDRYPAFHEKVWKGPGKTKTRFSWRKSLSNVSNERFNYSLRFSSGIRDTRFSIDVVLGPRVGFRRRKWTK